jgi:hypothetical protein
MTYTQDAQQNRKTTAEKGLAEPKPNEVSISDASPKSWHVSRNPGSGAVTSTPRIHHL